MTQPQLAHQVLDLDQGLMLLALTEALDLQGQLIDELRQRQLHDLVSLARSVRLRLTYYALRCPEFKLRSDEVLALHKLDQASLSSRLQQVGRSLHRLQELGLDRR